MSRKTKKWGRRKQQRKTGTGDSYRNYQRQSSAPVGRGIRPQTWSFIIRTTPTLQASASAKIELAQCVNDPTNFSDFSSLAALFDSYRVLEFRFVWLPFLPQGSSTTADYFPALCTYDPDATTNPYGTLATGMQYDTTRVLNIFQPIDYKIKPFYTNNGNLVGWEDFASVGTIGYFKFYAEQLDTASNYGTYYYEMKILCKDRR